jgi:hypothetical protein
VGIIDIARRDIKKILTDGDGFAVEGTLVANDEDHTTITVNLTAVKHNYTIDLDGSINYNGENARCTVSINELTDLLPPYPCRNTKGQFNMIGHKVTWTDSSNEFTYIVSGCIPNENLGYAILLLKTLKAQA